MIKKTIIANTLISLSPSGLFAPAVELKNTFYLSTSLKFLTYQHSDPGHLFNDLRSSFPTLRPFLIIVLRHSINGLHVAKLLRSFTLRRSFILSPLIFSLTFPTLRCGYLTSGFYIEMPYPSIWVFVGLFEVLGISNLDPTSVNREI